MSASRSDAVHLWAWPAALGVLIASGLLSALLSEGWGDVWSWLALGVPVAVMAWFSFVRPGARPRADVPSLPPQDPT